MAQQKQLPIHIAIIMDGNGRWAKKYKQPRNFGHQKGAKTLEEICLYANKIGISYMTVYAFSTENWNRPKNEIKGLMDLLRRYLKGHIKNVKNNDLKIKVIGDINKLPQDIQTMIQKLEDITKDKKGMMLNIALNYGGRDEIIRAIDRLLKDIENKRVNRFEISEEQFAQYLDTHEIPDPDLVIRTSGEQRLSNFLTWQTAYSEFYFTNRLWPDFDKTDLDQAIEVYKNRNRRFGNID